MSPDPWQVITDVTSELLRGGQTADIRCRAALRVLEDAGIDFDGNPVAAAARKPQPAPMADLYREALERLADEDTPVLGEGLGGGPAEELHVRASFAAHTLGRDTCGCTDCTVSLELEPDGADL